ncbi:DUF3138 family protein [Sphaerotilus mobilis]|uniref:Uncharacterized protein DUF3138 n=1 Tax=Sphaerotilus mobilis TaxID=47994 RepID=A0A4Q7LWS2_9BURK|nr:DUF3138 family protein [Sphaerotilus mobilis]RZS58269.1 uncharacterized protein DUF3138 [Sphaerotilus mobilis]
MKHLHPIPTPLALAAAALLSCGLAAPAAAQSNDELLRELRALKDRVNQLEQQLQAGKTASPATAAPAGQWGMTPEQSQELSRVATKAEALEDSRDESGFKGLKVSGYMDPTFIIDRNQNRAGFQFLSGVGDDGYGYANSTFGAVALDFTKETDSGTRWRLTLVPDRGTQAIMSGANRLVHEASVSVPIDGDDTTRLLAGHVPDWSGYEYAQPTLNKLITHNLLFDFTLPTAYTGAGLELSRGNWVLKGMLANMNSAIKASGERAPVFAWRADHEINEFSGYGMAGLHGKAANFSENLDDGTGTGTAAALPNSRVDLIEIDGWYTRGDLTLNGQISWGRQSRAAIGTATGAMVFDAADLRDAEWKGVSALVAYKLSPRLEGVVRGDALFNKKNGGGLLGYTSSDEVNGIGPELIGRDANGDLIIGSDPQAGVNRYALSFGLNYAVDPSVMFKTEVRFDSASKTVFENVKSNTFVKTNRLFATSLVVSF